MEPGWERISSSVGGRSRPIVGRHLDPGLEHSFTIPVVKNLEKSVKI